MTSDSPVFEILDARPTRLGELVLRRRSLPALDNLIIHEVKLGDEFLMSSLFHEAEEALAGLVIPRLTASEADVVVGGLGLGYTARAALQHETLSSLLVVEALEPVLTWHREGRLPLGPELTGDDRCRFVEGDFFRLAADPDAGFDPDRHGRRFDAILLDIDHTPDKVLSPAHRAFYTEQGLKTAARHLHDGGIFAIWSDDPPDQDFLHRLRTAFPSAEATEVPFPNPLTGATSANTIYIAS